MLRSQIAATTSVSTKLLQYYRVLLFLLYKNDTIIGDVSLLFHHSIYCFSMCHHYVRFPLLMYCMCAYLYTTTHLTCFCLMQSDVTMRTLPSSEAGKQTKTKTGWVVRSAQRQKQVCKEGGAGVARCGCCSLVATLQLLGGTGGACQCFVANRGGVDGVAGWLAYCSAACWGGGSQAWHALVCFQLHVCKRVMLTASE